MSICISTNIGVINVGRVTSYIDHCVMSRMVFLGSWKLHAYFRLPFWDASVSNSFHYTVSNCWCWHKQARLASFPGAPKDGRGAPVHACTTSSITFPIKFVNPKTIIWTIFGKIYHCNVQLHTYIMQNHGFQVCDGDVLLLPIQSGCKACLQMVAMDLSSRKFVSRHTNIINILYCHQLFILQHLQRAYCTAWLNKSYTTYR